MEIDPVRYEMFLHRLWAIGEEGRMTLQRVTASPIVSQGGECMSSFYDSEGTMVLACSGHLRFAAATSDAIRVLMEWFGQSPGFFDGDQIFFNDPYVAGSHTYDMMIIKPIFYQGKRIAWTASSTHTADTGGLLRGGAYEIFHEGIRILGLKLVEKGEFREDIFKTLTEQCRDPQYVGLDLKAMVAGNNVCARRYLGLVEKFGLKFVQAAGQKMIEDSESKARAKLRSIPDGRWRSKIYFTSTQDGKSVPLQVACTMTKREDELHLDFTGSSPQMRNDANSTLPATIAHIALSLTNTLFWDVPWSDGKMRPVKIHVPEGSMLNCKFPAACGFSPRVGQMIVGAVGACTARMLFCAGRLEDVNAGWYSVWYDGGPGFFYAGHNREGIRTAQGLYDIHGGGLGAAPTRDGVNTGGHMNIPSGGISDVERTEMQYPFLYFARNQNRDGSGFGKYRGGVGSYRIYLIYGSQDFSVDYKLYGRIPQGAYGLFGGYPVGPGGIRAAFSTPSDILAKLRAGDYPSRPEQIEEQGWGKISHPSGHVGRLQLPEFTLIADFVQGGGGYGDPLDRAPEAVLRDVRRGVTSAKAARSIYGVAVDTTSGAVNQTESEKLRREIRARRLKEAKLGGNGRTSSAGQKNWVPVRRVHEYLELVQAGSDRAILCSRCKQALARPDENYKKHSLRRIVDLNDVAGRPLPSGEPFIGCFHEYYCPGCATLLQVDLYCPELGGEEDLWDIEIA